MKYCTNRVNGKLKFVEGLVRVVRGTPYISRIYIVTTIRVIVSFANMYLEVLML